MRLSEVARFSFEALRDRRVRSILTVTMVVMGVSLITGLNALNAGFGNFIKLQFAAFAPNIVVVSSTQTTVGPQGQFRPVRVPTPVNDATFRTLSLIPGVTVAVPVVRDTVKLISAAKVIDAFLAGLDQSKLPSVLPGISLEAGDYVSPFDQSGMLLGHSLARPAGEPLPFASVGQAVKVEFSTVISEKPVTLTRTFIVRGVLEATGNVVTDTTAYISLPAATSFFSRSGRYDYLYLVTSDPVVNDGVEASIKARYGDTYGVSSPKSIAKQVNTILASFTSFTFSIAVVSLVVGSVGIITTLYTSVTERVREIGLLKALGASNRRVLFLFLAEAALIGVIGASLGLVGGLLTAQGLAEIMKTFAPSDVNPVFTPQDFGSIFLLAVALSVVSGLYPAWRASRLDPVVALRKE